MKIRTVAAVVLAGVLSLGAGGCSLLAPIATTKPYAPSDGVNADVSAVKLRNLMLVAPKEGGAYNVVFTAVNETEKPLPVGISFDGKQKATVAFEIPPGLTQYGKPAEETDLQVVDLGEQTIGSTVATYVQTPTGKSEKLFVPVLDGKFERYKPYALTKAEVVAALRNAQEDIDVAD